MPNEQLLAHLRAELARGVDRTAVTQSLLTAGWKVEDINAAIAGIDSVSNTSIPSALQVPRSEYISVPAVQVVKYAGFWVRVAAWFVDALLVGLPLGIMSRVLGDTIYVSIFAMIAVWGYILFMVTKYQATLGKMAVGLLIQGTNGEKIGFGRVFMREIIGKILSSLVLLIGYLMVAWTGKKQGLHDKIADTVVIEKDPNKSKKGWVAFAGLVFFPVIIPVLIVLGINAEILPYPDSVRLNKTNAAVISGLRNTAAYADIYYQNTNGTYVGYCDSPEAIKALSEASRYGSGGNSTTAYVCNDASDAWAASVHIKDHNYSACLDSTLLDAGMKNEPLADGQTSCGRR